MSAETLAPAGPTVFRGERENRPDPATGDWLPLKFGAHTTFHDAIRVHIETETILQRTEAGPRNDSVPAGPLAGCEAVAL